MTHGLAGEYFEISNRFNANPRLVIMSLRKTITEKEITYIHIHIEYDPK